MSCGQRKTTHRNNSKYIRLKEKKDMKKITIKTFCKEYNNRANDTLKKQYIKDNLEIKNYI